MCYRKIIEQVLMIAVYYDAEIWAVADRLDFEADVGDVFIDPSRLCVTAEEFDRYAVDVAADEKAPVDRVLDDTRGWVGGKAKGPRDERDVIGERFGGRAEVVSATCGVV